MLLTPSIATSLLLLLLAQEKGHCKVEVDKSKLKKLGEHVNRLLPTAVQEPTGPGTYNWTESDKKAAAVAVAQILISELNRRKNYSFHRLLAGHRCAASDRGPHVVLYLQLIGDGNSKQKNKHQCSPKQHVHCLWSGSLKNSTPTNTDGYLCYDADIAPNTRDVDVAMSNPCPSQKYGNSGFYRVIIPAHLGDWESKILLYKPPVTPLRDEKGPYGAVSIENAPMNPKGRTGIAGRGLLYNWGFNEVEVLIIIRKGEKTAEGNRVYEILKRDDPKATGAALLPTFYKIPWRMVNVTPEAEPMEKHFHALMAPSHKSRCTEKKLRAAVDSSKKIYNGYLAHPHSTDNAWVTGTIYVVTTKEDGCFANVDVAKHPEYKYVKFNKSEVEEMKELVDALTDPELSTEAATLTTRPYLTSGALAGFLVSAAVIGLVLTGAGLLWHLFSLPALFFFLAAAVVYFYYFETRE